MFAIEINNLYKIYKASRPTNDFFRLRKRPSAFIYALNNINMNIHEGEVLCLFGPNKSGKSTLIKILATVIEPTRGEIYIHGKNINREGVGIRGIINVVCGEERSFYWRLTGKENLYFFGRFYNLSSLQIKKRVDELLELLEIDEPNVRFQEYSSGTKQRLAIARGLLNNPRILLMDEPTKSLDIDIAIKIRDFIKKELVQKNKKTVLYTTHSLSEAKEISDRIAFIKEGKIKGYFATEELSEEKLGILFGENGQNNQIYQ